MKEFFLVFRILYVTIVSSQSDLTYSIKTLVPFLYCL